MLLAIDLGNTNVVIGVFGEDKLLRHWRISTRKWETADEFGISIKNLLALEAIDAARIDDIIVASVVPPLQEALAEMARLYFKLEAIMVNADIVSMPVRYYNPAEVGADRLVNAVAGYKKYGGPLIIVDFGTATTFCVISAAGEYLGGCIAPGVNISADALYKYTSKLPRVEIARPPYVIGRNTVSSIQSGLFYGYISLVDGIVERIRGELGTEARAIATGGLARLIGPRTRHISRTEPWLTLEGLFQIYSSHKPRR